MIDRRLAAVWFADLAGFTGLAHRDEDAALEAVDAFQAAVREAVEAHGGRVVKFLGDGALAEFGSAGGAAQAALDLQGALASSEGPRARVGIHVGEVARAPDGDLYGDGVNLAARIQGAAEPGGIAISEDAARTLRSRSDFRLEPLGSRSLKGLAEPVSLWGLARPEEGEGAPAHAPRHAPPRSIAVLPFSNLSADPENEYFSDGVTEEILTALARIDGLKVISRTSAMRYKGTSKGIPRIAAELGVTTVLEGSVRRAGDRVRITAQLIEASTDQHVWGERYDRDLEDIFAIQTDVAERIVEALRVRLTPRQKARLHEAPPTDRTAYEETLKGRWFANRRVSENLLRAIEHFERAIEADPRHAPAWAGVAIASVLLLYWDRSGVRKARDRAVEAAERAIELDPDLPDPWAARGMARIFDRDWEGADADFRRAIEVAPGDAQARQWRAGLLVGLGRYDEAIAEVDRALDLDPLSLTVITEAGNVRFLARRYDEAFEYYRQAIDLDPSFRPPRFKQFESQLALGRLEEAAEGAAGLGVVGEDVVEAVRESEAGERLFLETLIEQADVHEWPRFYVMAVQASLGRIDEAFEALEEAREEGDWYLLRVAVAPQSDPVRGDPRFGPFLESIGLEDVTLPDGTPAAAPPP